MGDRQHESTRLHLHGIGEATDLAHGIRAVELAAGAVAAFHGGEVPLLDVLMALTDAGREAERSVLHRGWDWSERPV